MNELDLYYRALLDCQSLTQQNRSCVALQQAIAKANAGQDHMVITRNLCTVDTDWLDAIEQGLPYVEKAIKEERQFIYSQGEVMEIEKVKNFSSESVRHLARHSNLITREQTGDHIVPDKLYSVERLSDYTVYENRFLYMLLCYLQDFVTLRYNKILELSNRYDGCLQMDKQLELPKQKLRFTVQLQDQRQDDRFLREHNGAQSTIDRIDRNLKYIHMLLSMPLMEITGKAPMLKPPITKTNVLKMDKNFKGAVALYDFIIAYDKPGYTITPLQQETSPFPDALAAEAAQAVALLSFITYAHGLELEGMLQYNYEVEESSRRQAALERGQQQLDALQRRLANGEVSAEQYILALEQQNKQMEKALRQQSTLQDQLVNLQAQNVRLSNELTNAQSDCSLAHAQLETIENTLRAEFDETRAAYDDRLQQMHLRHEEETKALEAEAGKRIEEITEEARKTTQKMQTRLQELDQQLLSSQSQLQALTQAHETLQEEMLLSQAQVKALRLQSGQPVEDADYTQQAAFEQLEREFVALAKFYQKSWNGAKKSIRRQLLSFKYLKGSNG